jgi:hypothetical protein
MEEELQDQPQASSSNSFQAAYYSDAASIVGTLVREYGWSMEFISRLPLKFVFQLLKEIADYHSACAGRSAILFNPSDRIKHERLQQLNSAIKKN